MSYVTITGASGFLGTKLARRLMEAGHTVHLLARSRKPEMPAGALFSAWDPVRSEPPLEAIQPADAIVHLAGEPVAQRWNDEVKKRIHESRRMGTRNLVHGLAKLHKSPGVLISASAIGYYGNRGEEVLTESSKPGTGFLSQVCVDWENEALAAEPLGIRVAIIRMGIVLGPDGGALKQMLPAFKAGVAGRLGSGKQWVSWIHVDDLTELFAFVLANENIRGPVNGVSPMPVRNEAFTADLASVLHRPAVFPVPVFGLKLMFGEMSQVLVDSQRVEPAAAHKAGFRFSFPVLKPALENLLS